MATKLPLRKSAVKRAQIVNNMAAIDKSIARAWDTSGGNATKPTAMRKAQAKYLKRSLLEYDNLAANERGSIRKAVVLPRRKR